MIATRRALAALFFIALTLAPARVSAQARSENDTKDLRQRYLALTRGWAEQAVFTPTEERAMQEGRTREETMTNSLTDVLGDQVLAKGEPSYAALAALYPGKILDRSLLGSYSDPTAPPSGSKEEFVIWWNGAISSNLLYRQNGNNRQPMAENTNVLFRVGRTAEMFGKMAAQYEPLGYEDRYLPILQATYIVDGVRYRETALADRLPGQSQDTAFIQFEMTNETAAPRSAELHEDVTLIDGAHPSLSANELLDSSGKVILASDQPATFDTARQRLTQRVQLAPHATATIVLTIPYAPEAPNEMKAAGAPEFAATHVRLREFWTHLLAQGTQINVPEKRVNDMWRALLLQNFVIGDGAQFTYGSGLEYNNSYFPFEDGFAAISMARYGYGKDAEGWLNYLIPASIDPKSAGYRYQNRRAMPLFLIYEEYRLTGRADYFAQNKEELFRVADEIVSDRHTTMTPATGEKPLQWGLLPQARPAVDSRAAATSNYVIAHDITNCQGLQDFGEFLVATGIDFARGRHYLDEAADFRASILRAMNNSVIRASGKPPFVPLETLNFRDSPEFGPEPYDNLFGEKPQGSYYHYWVDMELHYNFFNPDDELAHWMTQYLEQRGGFVLGCTRARNRPGSPIGWINDNYNAGYYAYALRRGEVDRFLLGFYSRLAFDASRNTYVNSEAEPFIGYNTRDGGLVGAEYTFPNSAANAETLDLLRFMLILEERKDNLDTGILDLARGTPRSWLEDGKKIEVERAPTDFGDVSFTVESKLHNGSISARIQAPERAKYKAIRLYLRAPGAVRLKQVRVNGKQYSDFNAADSSITLPGGPAEFDVEAEYR
ncbi:MAG: hypothetical protein ACRD3E_12420 [Terriglobales bacterium]